MMKVLLNCHTPFHLAHGGAEVQILQTIEALRKIGIDVEPLKWFESHQPAQIIHHFGRTPSGLINLAHSKGLRVVTTAFESGLGSRSPVQRWMLGMFRKAASPLVVRQGRDPFGWRSYADSDACIAMTPYEAGLISRLFAVPASRLHVVHNGVENVFLQPHAEKRGKWLVCAATILPVKQSVKLARMAITAQTPLWFIGKPFSEDDPYFCEFLSVAKNSEFIRYDGPIKDRLELAGAYRQARGFVLLSKWESLSIAVLEASGCGCPLLLSDLPWATSFFGNQASYCPASSDLHSSAKVLKNFYHRAPAVPPPPKPKSWEDIARDLGKIYESVLSS